MKYTAPIGRTVIGKLGAEAEVGAKLVAEAQGKALRRLWQAGKRKKPVGKRYELLECIKTAEITLGHGTVRLDHFQVRDAIEDAIRADDWHFLYIMSRWHEKERNPTATAPDPLSVFMHRNWESWGDLELGAISGELKGLCQLDDQGIAEIAKEQRISNRAFKGFKFDGQRSVTERRLKLGLSRPHDPALTFRLVDGKLVLRRLR